MAQANDHLSRMLVRSLDTQDAAAYQALRLRALRTSPTAFSSSYADEAKRSIAEIVPRVRPAADGSRCLFGAFVEEELAGFVAFLRPERAKLSHCAEVAGMYVAEEFRQRGIGGALLQALVTHARAFGVRQLKLGVNHSNLAARRLYDSAGFVCFGTEPDALCVDGIYYDEMHYGLRLADLA